LDSSHGEQVGCAATVVVPPTQKTQSVACAFGIRPKTHDTQRFDVTSLEYNPAPQAEQFGDPAELDSPEEHAVHDAWAVTLLNVPAAQGRHSGRDVRGLTAP
jgi:hypothetical protein